MRIDHVRFTPKNEWHDFKYQAHAQIIGISLQRLNRSYVESVDKTGTPTFKDCWLNLINVAVFGFGFELSFYLNVPPPQLSEDLIL